MRAAVAAVLGCAFLGGCAGYQLGSIKPNHLKGIQTIAIPTFENGTLLPRIEVLVTNTVIKQFQQDGTYRIVGDDEADAILKCEILRVSRTPARSLRQNVLATTEFNLSMRVRYRLVGRDGRPLLEPGEVAGGTSFFVGTDIATDERQALPLAAEELAVRLVSQLSEGW